MSQHADWYLPVNNGEEPLGPFSLEDLKQRILAGELRLDDFVWGSHFKEDKWRRFNELKEFRGLEPNYPKCAPPKRRSKGLAAQQQQVALPKIDFSARTGEFGAKNLYRRFPRVPIQAEAIIHNNKRYIHGICVDVSEKGTFVHLDDLETFEKGEEVVVTIRHPAHIGTESIPGVIVRTVSRDGKKGIGIFFLRINPQVRRKLAGYVLEQLQAQLEPDKREALAAS